MTTQWIKTLFAPAKNPSSFSNIVKWWELRRIAFNVLVGAVGIVSFIVYIWLSITYAQKPGEDDFNPGLSAVFFAIVANAFYTSGWIIEGLCLAIRKHGSPKIGPRLFKLGLGFSLVLASLPGLILAVEVMFQKLHH